MDPRVNISAAGLERKFRLEMRLAPLFSQTSKAVLQAGSIREPLQKLSQQATGTVRDSVQVFLTKLAAVLDAPDGSAPAAEVTLTKVNGNIAVLYGQVWQADAEPTATQSEAVAASEHDALEIIKRWDEIKASAIPALNRELHAANLPEVQIESNPHEEDAGMDEE
jgi:hypothetical protein